jgi:hypothetical protein
MPGSTVDCQGLAGSTIMIAEGDITPADLERPVLVLVAVSVEPERVEPLHRPKGPGGFGIDGSSDVRPPSWGSPRVHLGCIRSGGYLRIRLIWVAPS